MLVFELLERMPTRRKQKVVNARHPINEQSAGVRT
jgi:hypothetical protein